MYLITALLAGLLFGLGLIVSGMTNPQKVLAFLDLTGNWDPSLAFVMLGAIPMMAVAYQWMKSRPRTYLQQALQIPGNRKVDSRLIAGAIIFGAGWGLVGYCPGPALASLISGDTAPVVFVLAMVTGMLLYRLFASWWDQSC